MATYFNFELFINITNDLKFELRETLLHSFTNHEKFAFNDFDIDNFLFEISENSIIENFNLYYKLSKNKLEYKFLIDKIFIKACKQIYKRVPIKIFKLIKQEQIDNEFITNKIFTVLQDKRLEKEYNKLFMDFKWSLSKYRYNNLEFFIKRDEEQKKDKTLTNEKLLHQQKAKPQKLSFHIFKERILHFNEHKCKLFIHDVSNYLAEKNIRAHNAMIKYFNSTKKIDKKLLIKLYDDASFLPKVGSKASKAIREAMALKLKTFNAIVVPKSKIEIQIDQLIHDINQNFNIDFSYEELRHLHQEDNSIDLFKLVEFIFQDQNTAKNKVTNYLINNCQPFSLENNLTLVEVANNFGKTRERIRQIKTKLLKSLRDKLSFISKHKNLFKFEINNSINIITVDESLTNAINKKSGVTFSKYLISIILGALHSEKFSLIGDIFKYTRSYRTKSYIKNIISSDGSLKNIYLIKNESFDLENFTTLLNNTTKKLSLKIEKDISISIQNYLNDYFEETSENLLEIVKSILINEYSEPVSRASWHYVPLLIEDNNIIIKRNTPKLNFEFVVEALKHFNQPTHKDRIKEYIIDKYPNTKSTFSVSGAVLKEDEVFIFFGRQSVYGLKSWEIEGTVKGGTIRDIVEEYLESYSEPREIKDIESEVLKWRPDSNAYSIISNLKLMNNNTSPFVFYRGTRTKKSLIGLKSKRKIQKNNAISEISVEDIFMSFLN